MIRIGAGKLKQLTLSAGRVEGIYDHLTWWENICKQVPAGALALLVSPYDLSWMNKVSYAKTSIRDKAYSDMFNYQVGLITSPPADVLCSRAVAKGLVIALVEE
jgi:hypothetical protein